MRGLRGSCLLVVLLICVLLYRSRAALPTEGPPAFSMEKTGKFAVQLGPGFRDQGLHQFSDDTSIRSVIIMTTPETSFSNIAEQMEAVPPHSGEILGMSGDRGENGGLTRRWMPAAQRIALGIPLHPDRMTLEDWEYLPGIGPRLAQAIERDRQLNGDFGTLEELQRVKGIGPKRIASWRQYFSNE